MAAPRKPPRTKWRQPTKDDWKPRKQQQSKAPTKDNSSWRQPGTGDKQRLQRKRTPKEFRRVVVERDSIFRNKPEEHSVWTNQTEDEPPQPGTQWHCRRCHQPIIYESGKGWRHIAGGKAECFGK